MAKKITAEESLKELRRYHPFGLIKMERIQQDVKWGEQNHSNEKWLSILLEELGEAATAMNELDPVGERKYPEIACIENLEIELVQVAAVSVAWIESLRRKYPID